MLTDEDVFGSAIQDFNNGELGAQILVYSSISEEEVIPVSYLFRKLDEIPALEQEALNHCKGKILDIGAGAGCHALILQAREADVKAIDISKKAVEVMRVRGVKETKLENVFDLEDQKFDTLLLLMNGLGIVGSLAGLDQFLIKSKKLLNPGGIILTDSTDILYMFMEDDGSALIPVNTYYGEVKYQMEYKGKRSKEFDWLYIDYENLEGYALAHGFTCELLYEDEDNSYLVKLTLNDQF